MEFAMSGPEMPSSAVPSALPRPEVIHLMLTAVQGVFPGPVLEALIARMEAGK
jgi:hypothetical protein